MTLLEAANRLPPCICRLVARKNNGRTPLSTTEIAKLSGVPRSTVAYISRQLKWDGISIDVVERFSLACGVNHLAAHHQVDFFKRRNLPGLKYARGNQRKFFQLLLKRAAAIAAQK